MGLVGCFGGVLRRGGSARFSDCVIVFVMIDIINNRDD